MDKALNVALLGIGVSFVSMAHTKTGKPWMMLVGGALLGIFAARVS